MPGRHIRDEISERIDYHMLISGYTVRTELHGLHYVWMRADNVGNSLL